VSNTAGITANQIEQTVALLREKFAPELIYLFGSAVRGELRLDSDLDFAFLSEQFTDNYQVFIMAQQLADIVKRDVDLIDLHKASTVLKAQIVSTGKNIYASDANRRINFEIVALKEYALLNEERQLVLDNFVKEVKQNGK
jgi:predicted nucleotidyltransferase